MSEHFITDLHSQILFGSDAHRLNHSPPELLSGVNYIYENCDKEYADAVCFGNAERLILNNK